MAGIHHRILSLTAVVGLAVQLGCSGGSTLGTHPVQGLVTLDGTPVAGATVMFQPVNQGQGASATGLTDENGVYRLTSTTMEGAAGEPGAGALAGDYYVGVRKSSLAAGAEMEAMKKAYEAGDPSQLPQGYRGGAPKAPAIEHIVPQKYNNPEESGIRVTVESGNNDIPLELSSS
jgi:hypothetical protein